MGMRYVGGDSTSNSVGPLAGRRVVVTGSSSDLDIALSEGLAAAGARVMAEDLVTAHTADTQQQSRSRYDAVLALMQEGVGALNGLDAVVALVELEREALSNAIANDAIEDLSRDALAGPIATIRVALNRMETTWVEGCLVVVLVVPAGLGGGEALVAQIVRAELADVVRHEATRAAPLGISVRGVIVDQDVCDDPAPALAAIFDAVSPMPQSLNGVAVLAG